MKIEFIANTIEQNRDKLISLLTERDIQFYQFIKDESLCADISKNLVFQFVFSNFYTLDNRKLTPEFKAEYFKLMENVAISKQVNIVEILLKLHEIPVRGQNKYHFSFTSKLANTIDDSIPIWDSLVLKMFDLKRPINKEKENIIRDFQEQIQAIQTGYQTIVSSELLKNTLILFDEKFKDNKISTLKKIDFIFWAAGKIDVMKYGDGADKFLVSDMD